MTVDGSYGNGKVGNTCSVKMWLNNTLRSTNTSSDIYYNHKKAHSSRQYSGSYQLKNNNFKTTFKFYLNFPKNARCFMLVIENAIK